MKYLYHRDSKQLQKYKLFIPMLRWVPLDLSNFDFRPVLVIITEY